MVKRKVVKPVFYGLVLSASLGFGLAKANAQSVEVVEVRPIEVVQVPSDTEYCHYKFPAVVSLDPGLHGTGGRETVDYYGTCDRRAARSDEIQNEWNQTAYQWETNYSS